MVEERVKVIEQEVTNLRISQAEAAVKLNASLLAIQELTVAVDHLTAAMNRANGEHSGAKAVLFAVGSILGAIGAMVVEWFASHR